MIPRAAAEPSATLPDLGARVRALLEDVPDPEIPVVSVTDLGIVRDVHFEGETLVVGVTPTWSACPATEVIEAGIAAHLKARGYAQVEVRRLLAPPWTTDWITRAGREKLARFGIAPPPHSRQLRGPGLPVACPRCESLNTVRISEFGSTPCKAAYRCDACLEPFDRFKCL